MKRLLTFAMIAVFTFSSISIARTIKAGSSMGLTSVYAELVSELINGINIAFKNANKKNALGNDRIVFVVYDDSYNSANTVSNLQKLYVKDKVDFLFAIFGTPPSIATAERLRFYKWLLFFPITGFSQLYSGELSEMVFTLLPSYDHEARQLVDLAKKHGTKSLGIIYYANLYGFDVVGAAEQEARRLGIKIYKYSYLPTKETSEIAASILRDRPDALLLAIPKSVAKSLMVRFVKSEYYPDIYGEFYTRIASVMNNLPSPYASKFKRVYTSSFLPRLSDNYRIVKEYKRIASTYGGSLTPAEFEGYVLASSLVKVLQRVGSWKNTMDLKRKVENIRDLDIGLPEKISYSPKDHTGLTKIFIYQYKNGNLYPVH